MLANSEFTVRHQCDITMEVHSLGRALPLSFRARYNRIPGATVNSPQMLMVGGRMEINA